MKKKSKTKLKSTKVFLSLLQGEYPKCQPSFLMSFGMVVD